MERFPSLWWWVGTIAAAAGAVGFAFSEGRVWNILLVAGALVLAARLGRRLGVHRSPMQTTGVALGAALFLAGALGFDGGRWGMPRLDTALLATGTQLFFLAVTFRDGLGRSPGIFPMMGAVGHGVVAVASVAVARGAPVVNPRYLIWYAVGFVVLLVHAFWVQRSRGTDAWGPVEPWEALFLAVQATALSVVAVYAVFLIGSGTEVYGSRKPLGSVIRLATVSALSIMAGPPRAPGFLVAEQDSLADLLLNAVTFTSLVNVILLSLFLADEVLILPLFILLTGWLAVAVFFEYAATLHALATRGEVDPTGGGTIAPVEEPVTAVVTARNEAALLADAVTWNLETNPCLQMLLVPAESSTDGTVEVAEELAREHPDRIRVHIGRGGSKAVDLNQAWEQVETDFVLILDADEKLHEQALGRALALLEEHPDVGVVQGRKVAAKPGRRPLGRFATVERRFSTRLDQWFQSRVFDAAHFAGSVALLRREVPPSVGGWNTASLTEDIEFTVRLYLETSWRIAYEPRMIAQEANPRTLGDLLRQRSRWARGWSQVFQLHMVSVLRSLGRQGPRRTAGLTWKLMTAVSAPWSLFLPALALLWLVQEAPIAPTTVGLTLGVLILPSRAVAYLTAYFGDPVARARATPLHVLEVLLMSYAWVLFGWFLQLHALYLEVSQAENKWFVTGKEAPTEASPT